MSLWVEIICLHVTFSAMVMLVHLKWKVFMRLTQELLGITVRDACLDSGFFRGSRLQLHHISLSDNFLFLKPTIFGIYNLLSIVFYFPNLI